MYDTVIKNGLVIDPANRIYSKLNIGIKDGKIACLSRAPQAGGRMIDAAGLVVSPGFVDIHMHEDAYSTVNDDFMIVITDCMLKMGVTTAIGGNCGIGPQDPRKYLAMVDEKGLPVNTGLFVPHHALRQLFSNNKYEPVSPESVKRMAQKLDEHLRAGCVGLSMGLRYIPGTSRKELLSLAEVAARHGKIVAAHVRDDAAGIFAAINEMLDIASCLHVKVQISHIGSMAAFGQMDDVLALVDDAYFAGVDIGLDCYPYNAFCTLIGSTTYDAGFLERYQIDYHSIEITGGKYRGQRCTEAVFKEVRSNNPDILAVAHVMRDAEVDQALAHPRTVLASDGILQDGAGHPRAAGSFPRFIHQYVKTKKLLNLYDAIEKMTILPARRIGLNKGSLSAGSDADITIFDYEAIRDEADFASPLSPPQGVRWVLIGGKVALEDGVIVNNRLGRSVRV